MRDQLFKDLVLSQFESALDMMAHAIQRCPTKHWEGIIGKYPFWQVAYHALCFVDLYTATDNDSWRPHPDLHPKGVAELRKEFPSRSFSKAELLGYVELCNQKVRASLAAESARSFGRPSGFAWVPVTRAELPIYSLRHLQHHVGQLTASLRRAKVSTRWGYKGRVLVPATDPPSEQEAVTAPPTGLRRRGGSRR
jgi:hypothetical protein